MTEAPAPTPFKLSWYPALAAVFLIFVAVAVYSSSVASHTSDYDQDRAAARYQTLAKLRADDEKALTTADWVDQAKGTVRIPIDEAIPQAIAMLQAKPMQAGAAIPGAKPAASAPNTLPAMAANQVPANSPQASPSTNAAPAPPAAPVPTAPNK